MTASVPCSYSERVSWIEEALRVWEYNFNCQKVVCKPPRSGGSDGVQVCSNKNEIIGNMQKFHVVLTVFLRNICGEPRWLSSKGIPKLNH